VPPYTWQFAYTYNRSRQIASEAQTTPVEAYGGSVLNPISYGANNLGQQTLNQVISVTPQGAAAVPFTYDHNGNLTSDGGQNFTWDLEGDGHLLASCSYSTSVPTSSPCYGTAPRAYGTYNPHLGDQQSYSYDPFGRRYAVTDLTYNSTTIYVHDNYDHEIAEYDGGSGNLWQNNVFDTHDRAPVAEILTPYYNSSSSYSVQFLHFDARGTNFMFTIGGNEVNAWNGAPDFGLTNWLIYPDYAYAGYRFDDATQLYYLGHRYYAPYLGRFISPDPTGLAAGINMYAYGGNDPVNNVDPRGLSSEGNLNGGGSSSSLIQATNQLQADHQLGTSNQSASSSGLTQANSASTSPTTSAASTQLGNFDPTTSASLATGLASTQAPTQANTQPRIIQQAGITFKQLCFYIGCLITNEKPDIPEPPPPPPTTMPGRQAPPPPPPLKIE
jgi:RHS repeat-associated protein